MDESPTDAALVAESVAGNRKAFQQLVERYQAMVCAITYALLGDLSASEDAAQETFVVAWQRLGGVREPERLRAWLAGIARNVARSSLRKRQRDPLRRAESLSEHAHQASGPATAETAARREEERLLWQVLEQLPETYREPLVLYYREHQSIAEVAEAMNLNEDAVKQRLARGRQALKDQISTLVESTLRRTGPSAAFSSSVLAALDGKAVTTGVAGTMGLFGGATLGILGAILGTVLGLGGGILGTLCTIRNTKTPRERSVAIQFSIWCWIYTIALVSVYLVVAFAYNWLFTSIWFQFAFWSMHVVILTAMILVGNRRLAAARGTEQEKPAS